MFACVCESLGSAPCLARKWLFVVGMTSKKTKKVCARAMCEFSMFAACTCADSASSAAAKLPWHPRPSLHGPSLARRYSDVVSGNRYGILELMLDSHGVLGDCEQHGYLMGREEE